MNNYWTTNFNADQMGELQWSYHINSSADNSIEHATKFAWENRIPLLTRILPEGNQPKAIVQPTSLLEIKPANILLVNMRPVEGERALLLQLREIDGKKAIWEVNSKKGALRTTVCDVLGDPLPGNPKPDFDPWENKFIKLSW
jgi:alpha-mannosidase